MGSYALNQAPKKELPFSSFKMSTQAKTDGGSEVAAETGKKEKEDEKGVKSEKKVFKPIE